MQIISDLKCRSHIITVFNLDDHASVEALSIWGSLQHGLGIVISERNNNNPVFPYHPSEALGTCSDWSFRRKWQTHKTKFHRDTFTRVEEHDQPSRPNLVFLSRQPSQPQYRKYVSRNRLELEAPNLRQGRPRLVRSSLSISMP